MTDHFERLGLPRRFVVDAGGLERAYLDRSRELHPDRHGTAADQTAVLTAAAAVNDAYNTLRDPLRRGEHLLALLGGPPAGSTPADPAFLMDMMDARDRLEAGDAAAVDNELARSERDEFAAVTTLFAAESPDLPAIRVALDRLKTLASLRRDARAAVADGPNTDA